MVKHQISTQHSGAGGGQGHFMLLNRLRVSEEQQIPSKIVFLKNYIAVIIIPYCYILSLAKTISQKS